MRDGSIRFGMMMVAAGIVIAAMGATALGEEGITVQGNGEAKGRPTQVEIAATLTGEAELATDATVKFRDAKKRALAAIAGMKNPDLSVASDGVSVNSALDANTQMMMMRGQAVQPGNQKVQVKEASRIVLVNADKLEQNALLDMVLKILDTAKDAGFIVGVPVASNYYEMQMQAGQGNAIVTFKLPDPDALRDQAYKGAIEDAKSRAQKIAELSGVKLGRILSVTEEDKSSDSSMRSFYQMMYGGGGGSKPVEKAITGQSSGDLTLRVNLTVVFEIAK